VVPAADAISRPQNTLPRRAVNLAGTIIVARNHAGTKPASRIPAQLRSFCSERHQRGADRSSGESLAKYRGKPAAAPMVEHEAHDQQPEAEEATPRALAPRHSPPPQAVPTFRAGSRAAFLAGFSPMAVPKQKRRPR